MNFLSTRSNRAEAGFGEILLNGLAPDGGLYMPAEWPELDTGSLELGADARFSEYVHLVLANFVGAELAEGRLGEIVSAAFSTFSHQETIPLRPIDDGLWLMELFHGPTLAFKDIALQVLGRLLEDVARESQEEVLVLGATTGDTGPAAIHALRDRDHIRVVILHPRGRISDIQRRQMTSVESPNVLNLSVHGDFDDCQAIVKEMLVAGKLGNRRLTTVNSINLVRILAQAAYYFWALSRLVGTGHKVSFAVPTGNFGDAFAGIVARKMGAQIHRIIVATNRNDSLAKMIESGWIERPPSKPSLSPAMDVTLASNLERAVFLAAGNDAEVVATVWADLTRSGRAKLPPDCHRHLQQEFEVLTISDDDTLSTISNYYRSHNELIDPHTAVALCAAKTLSPVQGEEMVVLSTAHPAKFGDTVEKATGHAPALPASLKNMLSLPERVTDVTAELAAVRRAITSWMNECA